MLLEIGIGGFDDPQAVGLAVTQGGGAVAALLSDHLLPLTLGEPIGAPADIEDIAERLRYATLPYGSGGIAAMARSVIDIALWDLLGCARGEPVHRLLGAERMSLPVYATGNDIEHHRELGFASSKVGLQAGPWHADGVRAAVAQVERARERAGDEHALMVDGWMGLTPEFVREIAPALSGASFAWLEEPLPPDATDALDSVAHALGDVALATGEHVTSTRHLLALPRHGVSVLQPDLAWCGGISAVTRLSRALPAGVELAPHLSGSPWGVHVAVALPQVRRVEWYVESLPGERPDVDGPLWGAPAPEGGTIAPAARPGLGVAVNWSYVERWAGKPYLIDAR